ncbi:FUSC family protein [Tomitella biformata]|uniref:FUSC family protein n=1 Tax=Tomitella biformata TaxID=630403 RepID=UPI00130D4F89|nr:FUSC family protein [Tomitella biformata]
MSDSLTLPGRLLGRLDVSDPGRLRLRNAWSVALSVMIAIVTMSVVSKALHQSMALVTVSGFMAMMSAGMVKDKLLHEREATTALVFLPAVGAVVVAALANKHWLVEDLFFVLAVFAAVWVRRYGPRGTACGMMGFFAYFFSLLSHGKIDGLPTMILALAIGIGSSLLVRIVLVRERPRLQMRRLRPALRAASLRVLDTACRDDRAATDRLHTRLDELGETAMAIEDWQSRFVTARHVDVSAADLSVRVFDAQIGIEQTASALWALDPREPWPEPLRRAVTALQGILRHPGTEEQLREAVATTRAATALPGATGVAGVAIWHATTAQAMLQRVRILSGKPAPLPQSKSASPAAPAAKDTQDTQGRWDWRAWNPATRAAIQCSVAAALATVLGELISADRWYWAVLTSFMVFYGTTTRGEILSRAWRRVLGTVVGVVVGLAVVFAVGHHPPVQLAMIVVCVFLMFYLGPLSYAYLTFFVTMLLASLYELLGVLNLKLLEWRVEETLAGAAVGIACAYFIMSTRSNPLLVARITGYLGHLDALVDRCVASVLAPGGDHELLPAARELDTALEGVITAAKPLESVGNLHHRNDARRWRRELQMNSRSAHALARAGMVAQESGPDTAPTDDSAAAFRRAADHVRENVTAVSGQFGGTGVDGPELATEHAVMNVLLTLPRGADGAPTDDGAMPAAVQGLSRVNRTLPTYAR